MLHLQKVSQVVCREFAVQDLVIIDLYLGAPASLALLGDLLKIVSSLSKRFDYLSLFVNGSQVEKEAMLLLTCSINTSENA